MQFCGSEHLLSKLRMQLYMIGKKKASATANILSMQITTTHHKNTKRLCNLANWSRACPTKLSKRA